MTPIVFIGLLLSVNLIIGILLFGLFLLTFYYFIVGNLTVTVDSDNGKIFFTWTKKYLFNYKDIEPVNVSDIKRIVVDNGILLKKIKTEDREVELNTAKIHQKDTFKLIYRLEVVTKENNGIKRIDSWDEWNEKGYLKLAYRINSVVLIFVAIAVTISIFKRGFDSRMLLFVMLLIPQMILYGRLMKPKIK